MEFTARAELYEKLEKARQLLSHALSSGELGELFERALDALIEQEIRKRFGAGKPRKPRQLKPGSRHVPVAIRRSVWERDQAQCTFIDGEARRCAEQRFLTIEHRTPFALAGAPTLENLCLLCSGAPVAVMSADRLPEILVNIAGSPRSEQERAETRACLYSVVAAFQQN